MVLKFSPKIPEIARFVVCLSSANDLEQILLQNNGLGFGLITGPRREKTCLQGLTTNTGADQPAHPRSLITAFVILFFKSITRNLAKDFLASLCS